MTQPAVSQRIAMLEAEFGGRLFDRGTRSVSITAKGRQLLVYADQILHLRTEMLRAMTSPTALTGTLRLGVAETIVHTWLTDLVGRVHSTYPGIELDLVVDSSPNLLTALTNHELDLAIMLSAGERPDIVNYELCRYPLAFVGPAGADFGREPVPLRTLLERKIITYPKGTAPYSLVREALSVPGMPHPRIITNSSLSTIVRMVEGGIGISAIPPVAIGRELAEGTLRLIVTEVPLPDLVFMASMPITPDGLLAQCVAELALEVAGKQKCELVDA